MERKYDLVVILDPEISAEEQEKLLTKVKKFISDLGGKLLKEKKWGKIELAYPISKKKAGFFVEFNFLLTPTKVPSLKQKMQVEEKLLRYLVVVGEKDVAIAAVKKPADKKQRSKEA